MWNHSLLWHFILVWVLWAASHHPLRTACPPPWSWNVHPWPYQGLPRSSLKDLLQFHKQCFQRWLQVTWSQKGCPCFHLSILKHVLVGRKCSCWNNSMRNDVPWVSIAVVSFRIFHFLLVCDSPPHLVSLQLTVPPDGSWRIWCQVWDSQSDDVIFHHQIWRQVWDNQSDGLSGSFPWAVALRLVELS